MTLSAWFWPSGPQDLWRTIVYRQTDAYFLTAGSGLWDPLWPLDDLVAGLVLAAAIWFVVAGLRSDGWRIGHPYRPWHVVVALFLAGCLVDAAVAPSGTVFGPLLAAVGFAATATRRLPVVVGWGIVALFTLVTVVALAHEGGLGDRLARDDGGQTRAAALGALLVVSALTRIRPVRERTYHPTERSAVR
jgi:hypothetical protein